MRVLLVASEAFPFVKTGGLADVVGALPGALSGLGADVRLLLPAYPQVLEKIDEVERVVDLGAVLGVGPVRLLEVPIEGTGARCWLIDCPPLYDRLGGPYQQITGQDHQDNFKRFGVLSRVAASIAAGSAPTGWVPDVVHTNDWQTGLVAAYLKVEGQTEPKTVHTIHNLQFLGLFPPSVLFEVGLPAHVFSIDGVEFHGSVSFMKAGCFYADRLTTVSPTYASEIMTVESGMGLHGLLAARAQAGEFTGILNGIDYDLWDPERDGMIARTYSSYTVAEGKAANKAALQEELGLDRQDDALLVGLVSRFTSQKGVDIVVQAGKDILDSGAQLAILGSGESWMEEALRQLADRHPGRIGARIGYDEPLAHRIQASSDIFLVPSRFEPCGLTQMYALRYGALPLVRRTGGLADTVVDLSDEWNGTGFLFDTPSTEGILSAFYRALNLYRRPDLWHAARQRAMAQDFGWDRAAREYMNLYEEVLAS